MSLIIDGYNLLHAIGIATVDKSGRSALRQARLELLNFLASALPPAERSQTVVVFDAAEAPRGLPSTIRHRGLLVRFAVEQSSADELIEQLVRKEPVPRRLTVVSSDHRIQQAARRRRATAVDSEPWYESVFAALQKQQRQVQERLERDASDEPDGSDAATDDNDIAYWLNEFQTDRPDLDALSEAYNPFPPGYAEDENLEEGENMESGL